MVKRFVASLIVTGFAALMLTSCCDTTCCDPCPKPRCSPKPVCCQPYCPPANSCPQPCPPQNCCPQPNSCYDFNPCQYQGLESLKTHVTLKKRVEKKFLHPFEFFTRNFEKIIAFESAMYKEREMKRPMQRISTITLGCLTALMLSSCSCWNWNDPCCDPCCDPCPRPVCCPEPCYDPCPEPSCQPRNCCPMPDDCCNQNWDYCNPSA